MPPGPKKAPDPSDDPFLAYARHVLDAEGEAVASVAAHLTSDFSEAVQRILDTDGRVVVAGMGKPGFIAQKLSATLASTGTPSLYLHPAEALHGDLGRVLGGDILIALSHSGETDEVLRLIQAVREIGVVVIGLTGHPDSTLARNADLVLSIGPVAEACPMGLAPTASSISLLALADALAMTVLDNRSFSREAYARLHPGGSLGRKLMKVSEIMRAGDSCPIVEMDTPISRALVVMTQTPGRPGATNVVDGSGKLVGIFTDGDLRRLLESGDHDFTRPVREVMGAHPRSVTPDRPVGEAAELLRDAKLDQLPVVDDDGKPVGLLDVQDLLAARII